MLLLEFQIIIIKIKYKINFFFYSNLKSIKEEKTEENNKLLDMDSSSGSLTPSSSSSSSNSNSPDSSPNFNFNNHNYNNNNNNSDSEVDNQIFFQSNYTNHNSNEMNPRKHSPGKYLRQIFKEK